MDAIPDIFDDDAVEAAAREAQGLAADAPIALHPVARRLLRESLIDERRMIDEGQTVLTRREHQIFGKFGSTRELEVERSGEVDVITDGQLKLITVASAFRRRRRLIIQSHPVSGPRPRGMTAHRRCAESARERRSPEGLRDPRPAALGKKRAAFDNRGPFGKGDAPAVFWKA